MVRPTSPEGEPQREQIFDAVLFAIFDVTALELVSSQLATASSGSFQPIALPNDSSLSFVRTLSTEAIICAPQTCDNASLLYGFDAELVSKVLVHRQMHGVGSSLGQGTELRRRPS